VKALVGIILAALTEAIAGTTLSLGRADIIGATHTTPDEFAWLDIGYTALKLIGFITAPWLLTRIAASNLIVISTLAMTMACGLAVLSTRLDLLITLRVIQGFAGGVLLVTGQAILFLQYPKARQPTLQALFAMGSVVAPATLAQGLQGWLLDSQSWTWIFASIVPIGVIAAGLLLWSDQTMTHRTNRRPFDAGGFALICASLCSFTYVASQGSRWDWFEETRITWVTAVGVASLIAFLYRQRSVGQRAIVDFEPFRSADFSFAFIVSFVAGAALFGSAYLILSFSISVLALTPTDLGMLLLPSGGFFIGALLLAGFLMQVRRVPPIATVPFGILLVMLSMWLLSGSTGESGADDMSAAILIRGVGLGLLFLSITLIAFSGLPENSLASGIGLFNTGRQLGALMGVAGLQSLINHHVPSNLSALAANLTFGTPAVAERLAATTAYLAAKGLDSDAASRAALTLMSRAASQQATVIAFDTAFNALALLFVVAAPLLIAVKIILGRLEGRRAQSISRPLSAIAAATIVTGCAVGPDYSPPRASVQQAWIASVDASAVDADWWRKIEDPLFERLIAEAIEGNKDIREANARLLEARANRDAVRGRALPQVGVSAAGTRNRISENGQLPVGKIPALQPDLSLYDVGFDAAWELDVWGAARRARESAEARAGAAEEVRRGVTIQLIAEVARSYFDLRTAQNLRSNIIADTEAQEAVARIVADRLRAGAASRFDLARARAQALSSAAAIPGLDSEAAAAAFRLALLVGVSPEVIYERLITIAALPSVDLRVSVGLRADLLRRRPDVRQAERELAAATADVGVATAELFPRISLLGSIGQQARSADDLISSDSLRFQAGPALRWPIYAGGRIRAHIRSADARAEAALVRYDRAVLTALADSETAINRFATSGQTRIQREAARHEADEAVTLARQRYLAGEDDLTALLQAQSAFSAADRLSIQARATELQQMAALYKALGGGWESIEGVTTISAAKLN
jgi:DHA2 family multidrug resistance protein